MDRIHVAISSVANTYGIDRRVLLGIMMEESHGGVGVVTTYNADGVPTGGLMQSSNCHGFDGQKNLGQVDTKNNPIPATSPQTPFSPSLPPSLPQDSLPRLTDICSTTG